MPTITIDNKQITVEGGVTILEAASLLGVRIPTMCYLRPGLQIPADRGATTSCMVCVVKVQGLARLLPACATVVVDGMVIESESAEVHEARKMALELLLGDHLGDCVGPCHTVCPAHMNIPLMISHIAAGRNREALEVIKEHIPIPAILGRICPEICEKGCRRGSVDKAVSICLLKRFAADVDLASESPYMPACKPKTGKSAAVIGAGPAGLSAAYYLAREGIDCTVFDENPLPGGTLRTDVPVEKLPREVMDAEVGIIEKMGVKFELGERVENPAELKKSFDTVIVATGAATDIKVDKHTLITHEPGIFAAGSAVAQHRHAVMAVADGRVAALSAAAYLAGEKIDAHVRPYTVRIGKMDSDELAGFAQGASKAGRLKPASDGFSQDEARAEAGRCLHCECAKLVGCKLRDYAIEYGADAGAYKGERRRFEREQGNAGLVYESGKCISCGICVAVAECNGEALGLAFIGRGFGVRIGVPFGEPLSEGLKKASVKCAEACPTGALAIDKNL